jgi:hypothetical protein
VFDVYPQFYWGLLGLNPFGVAGMCIISALKDGVRDVWFMVCFVACKPPRLLGASAEETIFIIQQNNLIVFALVVCSAFAGDCKKMLTIKFFCNFFLMASLDVTEIKIKSYLMILFY